MGINVATVWAAMLLCCIGLLMALRWAITGKGHLEPITVIISFLISLLALIATQLPSG